MLAHIKIIVFGSLLNIALNAYAQNKATLEVPGSTEFTKINKAGISVLPSGRYVKPAGDVYQITNDPFGLAISPSGRWVVSLHNGVLTRFDNTTNEILRVPDYNKSIKSPFPKGSFLGVAFGKTDSVLYLSAGDRGTIVCYNPVQLTIIDTISLNGTIHNILYEDSFTSDLVYNPNRDELLALDLANYRLVQIDCSSKKVINATPTGRLPFGLSVSPDGEFALVANVGMYEYPLIKGMNKSNYDSLLISRHPYGHNTIESKSGTVIDGKQIPGVGDPNIAEAMSVYVIDLLHNTINHKVKTGYQIGDWVDGKEVIGGSSPNSIAVGKRMAYITNATNDNITVLDYRSGKIVKHIQLLIDSNLDKLRGYLPFGIELSPDEKRLYVALLGLNAVAVLDIDSGKSVGLIPAGWGPTRVKISKIDSSIFITSCRGLGAGPNGGSGFTAPVQGTYVGDIQLATLQRVPLPADSTLQSMHSEVINYTYQHRFTKPNFLPAYPGERSTPIEHIVYITKENRTYDEVFGQLEGGNGDTTLSRFGNNVKVVRGRDTLQHVSVSPNHSKIAQQFSFSDNFYCDSDASIHGHHWMMGVIPNEWVEANSNTSKTAMYFSSAPGRRFPGSTGSMDPEDFAETGGLWEALERSGISFYNFGEANETAHVRENWYDTATGAAHGVMVPMQNALFKRTSQHYAGYNTNIPDQFRVEQFTEEFKKMWIDGKDTLPSLITIQLPNDHASSPRPEDGYPFVHSYIADNDLALGRIITFLSQTSFWKKMLVIITEDDPQGGVDHIDAHRSILMMAGPYVKKGYVSHTHANFGSILKTIYHLLGIPYVNQYDLTASLLDDFFTAEPNFTPYQFDNPDLRIFNPVQAMKKYNRNIDWRQVLPGVPMDDVESLKKVHYNKQ
jgi:DNA-binding beta-propeller fold protein YncE